MVGADFLSCAEKNFTGWNLPQYSTVLGLGNSIENLALDIELNKFLELKNNINISQESKDVNIGLFTEVKDSNLRDMKIKDFNYKIKGSLEIKNDFKDFRVGGLAGTFKRNGYNNFGKLSNISVLGKINTDLSYSEGQQYKHTPFIGGLIGVSDSVNIDNSYSNVKIDFQSKNSFGSGWDGMSGSALGGLIGVSENSLTQNSYAVGNMNLFLKEGGGRHLSVGGMIGYLHNGRLRNSYALNTISVSCEFIECTYGDDTYLTHKGGIVGYVNHARIENSFFNKNVQPNGTLIDGYYGKTTDELKQKSTFKDWDFDKVWRIDEGNDYPRLRALTEGTVTISPDKVPVNVKPTTPVPPTTPRIPVHPNISNIVGGIVNSGKEIPKNVPCLSISGCIATGVVGAIDNYRRGIDERNRKIGELVAQGKREEAFLMQNPSVNRQEFNNYLDEMYKASQNPQYISNKYLADFPQDLTVSVSSKLTLHNYLSKVIQYHHLNNLQNQYNSELCTRQKNKKV